MASPDAVKMVLKILDSAWPRPLDLEARDERNVVYYEALDDLSDEEVLAAAKLALKNERFFPSPGVLREFVRPKVSVDAAITSEAAAAYERVLSCNYYTPESGAVWSYRQIRDEIGEAAAEAWAAAGGNSSFSWADETGASIRFKRFMDAYREYEESKHAQRAALHEGAVRREISHSEAKALLGGLADRKAMK